MGYKRRGTMGRFVVSEDTPPLPPGDFGAGGTPGVVLSGAKLRQSIEDQGAAGKDRLERE